MWASRSSFSPTLKVLGADGLVHVVARALHKGALHPSAPTQAESSLGFNLAQKMREVEKRRRRDKEKAGVSLGMRPFFCLPFRRNCETLEALAGNFDGKNI